MTNTSFSKKKDSIIFEVEANKLLQIAGLSVKMLVSKVHGIIQELLVSKTNSQDCDSYEIIAVDAIISRTGILKILEFNSNPTFRNAFGKKLAVYSVPIDAMASFLSSKLYYLENVSKIGTDENYIKSESCHFNSLYLQKTKIAK